MNLTLRIHTDWPGRADVHPPPRVRTHPEHLDGADLSAARTLAIAKILRKKHHRRCLAGQIDHDDNRYQAMKKLLLVDADPLSLCMLDVSLRKAGFHVTTAGDGAEALEKVEALAPSLVLTDTRLPKLDGYALVRSLRDRQETSDTPVVFLGSQESLDDRKKAHELGVEDYLPKPVFLAELIARINLVLARRTRENVSSSHASKSARTRFTGSTQDFALVDLLRNFELTRRTGVIHLRNGVQEANIYFRDGKAIDADLGALHGEEAIFRAMMWNEASFELELKAVGNDDVVVGSTSALVQRGMQRVDEWVRLCDQVQSLAALLDIHPPELLERLSRLTAIPDSLHGLLRLSPPPDVRAALPAMAAPSPAPAYRPPSAIASGVPTSAPTRAAAPETQTPGAAAQSGPSSIAATSPVMHAVAAPVPEPSAPPDAGPAVAKVAVTAPPAAVSAAVRPATPPPAPVVIDAAPTTASRNAAQAARTGAGLPAPSAPPPASVARPSDAPWSREVPLDHDPALDADAVAAGVPRAIGATTKRVIGTGLAAAAILFVVVGLNSVRARQLREAEAARSSNGLAAATTSAVTATAQPAAPLPSAARPGTEAPAASAPELPTAAAAAPSDIAAKEPAKTGSLSIAKPGVDPNAAPVLAAYPFAGISTTQRKAVRETALDTRLAGAGQLPLVSDAERALLKGETDRALTLAHQAVVANAENAEAWLTLAAAQKASGDFAGAHESYRSCIGRAQTVGVDHCRVLASRSEQ